MNIVLTGMMGSGKSSVGKELASYLLFNYLDTDEMIEKKTKLTINEIFRKYGEEYFRKLETETVKLVSVLDSYVISTGGGIVINKENMDILRKSSLIINLWASPEILWERLKNFSDRPLLKVKEPVKKLKQILKEREKYYRDCDLQINTENKKIRDIIEEIVLFLKNKT